MGDNPAMAAYIQSLPLSILETIPAESPPLGITPNFNDPKTCATEVIVVCSIFLVIAFACYVLRIYTKLRIAKRRSWDDLTITGGFILSIIILAFYLNGLINGGTGKHQWDLHLDKSLNHASMIQGFITVCFSQPALGLIKGSIFIQYYNLFYRLRWMRIAVWIGATVLVLFYTAVTILFFVCSTPRGGESFIDVVFTKRYTIVPAMSIPTGVIGLALDIYLFVLPIPAVVRLQMNTMKKLGVLAVFTTGGLAVVASAVCLVYRIRLQVNANDTTWKVAYTLLCNQVEMFAGVTVSSMPSVKHFASSFSDKSSSRFSFSSMTRFIHKSRSSASSEKGYESNKSEVSSEHSPSDLKTESTKIRVTKDYSVSREVHDVC